MRRAEGFDGIVFAFAADDGMATGEIAEDGDFGRSAAGGGLAEGDFIAETNEIAADGVDPEHQPIGHFG